MAEIEDKLKWLQALVVNQWKTGKDAELRLYCENGHLKVNVCADLGLQTPSWRAEPVGAYWGSPWGASGRGSPSRLRRRQRRAATRTAEVFAATTEDADQAAQERNSEKDAAEKAAAGKSAEKAAAEKAAAERAAAEIAASKEVVSEEIDTAEMKAAEKTVAGVLEADHVASTSCIGIQLPDVKSCWNCEGEMSNSHQCDSEGDDAPTKPPPAPSASYALGLLAEPPLGGAFAPFLPRAKMPRPSAPVVLKKPVRMLNGSPIWTSKTE